MASPVPTTAGMAYSRATREACAARVPPSVTTAAARANSGVHAGAVAFATRTSPVAEPGEVLRAVHDAYRSGGAARRGRMPDDDTLANLPFTAGFLHGAVDHVPDQPGRPSERQRRGEAALALPQLAALTHDLNDRLSLASRTSGHFVAGAEEHVIGLLDCTGRDQVLAEPADAGTQDRPGEGEVAGLFLSDDRVPLIDLQQLLELAQQPWLTGEGGPARLLGRAALLG